jgi:uncharacterized repeat protein (TIGR01451 family)
MTRMLRLALVSASLCIVALAFSATASATFLSPTPDPLAGSNFQGGDGDQADDSGHIDWQTLASVPPGDNGFVVNSTDSTTDDSCFGSPNQKQLNPGGWVFIDCGTGVNPSKDNLLAGWSSVDHAGDTFLYLAFTREAQTGNTYLAFELNQQAGTFHNPAGYDVPCRTGDGDGPLPDDLIISYQVESGGTPPNVEIVVHRWKTLTASASDPRHCALTGTVDELDPQPFAEGAVNAGSIPNYLNGGSPANFLAGTFGEAALNLSGFFRSYLNDRPCFAFGSISMESHSSTSFTSDLKDFIGPTPLSVANCQINVDKQVRVRTGGTPSDPTTDTYADSASAVVGSTFDYKFDVSVPAGSRALSLTDIHDVLGTQTDDPSFCAPQAYLGANAPHNYGDTNDNDVVDPGEHWLFTCSHTSDGGDVAASPLHNTVFVEGKVPGCTGSVADCGASDDDDASASVTKAQPAIGTTAVSPVGVGGDISDTATVSGGYSPSGQVRFDLYGPADPTCDDTPVYTDTQTLTDNGNGTFSATSGTYTTTSAGDYHWIASYLGNASDKAVAGNCGDDGETSHVDKANPAITTVASAATDLGHAIHDTAHVSGYSPTGSVTFTVYGPNDANCSGAGTAVGSGQLDANGDATSPDYTPTAVGTYRWIASYSGDGNNNTVSGNCNDAGESVDVRQPQLAINKTGPDHAYDGDVITFDITVTNPGTSDVHDVQLSDKINGTNHGCDSISGPTGDTNGDSVLQPSETWKYVCTYTVQHGDEDATHHVVNTATVQGTNSFGEPVGPVSDDAPVLIVHPAIAIDKSGPARANVGDKVAYTLTVTNPGDESFAEATVKVTDAQCNGDPVTLIGKGGDASPASLDPGDTWTYTCSVQTTTGQTSIHNVASVTGCDQYGKCVNASDDADTVLDAQIVEPIRITPGTAKLAGATGCQSRAFNARIRGSKIATVTFVLDGKVVKKVKNTKNASLIALRVNPSKLKLGVHRLVVNITFQAGSGTKPKTLRLSFQRCGKKLISPRFTG